MSNAPPDDRDRLELLQQRRGELLQLRRQLKGMLGDLDVLIAEEKSRRAGEPATSQPTVAARSSAPPDTDNEQPSRSPGRPLRVVVLDALDDIAWPSYSRELSQFCSAWTGRTIQPERFGSLANDEMKAFQRSLEGSRVRPVWLCFALTHDRYQPIKRLWARSDWPLERRIIAPTSGRVQHLKLTAKLCELAGRGGAENSEMMGIIAADHARDLPGVRVQHGKFEVDVWRRIALELLQEFEPRDAEARLQSADRLRDHGPIVQLFGAPEAEDVPPQERQRRV